MTFEQRLTEIPSRKPHIIGHNLPLKKFFFLNYLSTPLLLAPGNAALLCFTEKSRTFQKRDPLKSAIRPKEPLPAPNLLSYSSRGGIQGVSKVTPFGFQPSPQVPHPSVPHLLPNTDPTLSQVLAIWHLKNVQVSRP